MGRQQTQVVPLDLRGGCLTNETGFFIGPRFRATYNAGWQPFRSTSDLRRRSLGILPHTPATPILTLPGATHNEAGHCLGLLFNDVNRGVIVCEEIGTGHLLVYREVGGTLIADTGNALIQTPDYRTAAIADWPSIAFPETYISHPGLTTEETYQWDGTALIPYAPLVTPGLPFKGNSALLVHLDRLFMAKQLVTNPGRPRTLIFYTDPLDPLTVRSTNFIDVPDYVTSLFRASSSPIDVGAQAHLVIGAYNSVSVLDGDPTQGNAVLRRLKFGVGISDLSCVAPTPYGAVVLATDGQFYLIPPGAQDMEPLSPGNRDQALFFDVAALPGREANASLAWASPYAYYCPGDLNACWAIDFSQGSSAPPKWWGPLRSEVNGGDFFGARVYGAGVEDGRNGSTKIRVGATQVDAIVSIYEIDLTAEEIAGRQVILQTGYFQSPDHRVKMMRLVLMTTRKHDPTTITATAILGNGAQVNVTRQPDVCPATATKDQLAKTVFQFDALGMAGDLFYLELRWPVGVEPDLQDGWVEFWTSAKAD